MIKSFEKYLGEYYDIGLKKLKKDGFTCKTEEVKPYEDMEPSGEKRIIDIRKINNKNLKIIWSYEDYN